MPEAQTASLVDIASTHKLVALDGSGALIRANAAPLFSTQEWFIPAAALIPHLTNGAQRSIAYMTTNAQPVEALDFDQSTQEYATALVVLPKRWNLGTLTFSPLWTAGSGSGNVIFDCAAVAVSNDDTLDVAFGTVQTSTDTLLAANDLHVGPTSPPITIAGTPAVGDAMWLRVSRQAAAGGDTLNADARLLGIRLYWTVNAVNDA